MNDLNYSEKLSLLQNLLRLTRVDNIESEVEIDFIYRISDNLQVSREDVDRLLEQKIEFTPPREENKRIVLFYTYLLLMGVDGNFAKEEINFCKDIGFKLGLNHLAVHSLVEKMVAEQGKKLPAEEVINYFKLYHN